MKRGKIRDRRPIDELSIEELERYLAIRKREERIARLDRYNQTGRMVEFDKVLSSLDPVEAESTSTDVTTDFEPHTSPAPTPLPPLAPEVEQEALDPVTVTDPKVAYFEGDPRFEDELPVPRQARQRYQRRTSRTSIASANPPLIDAMTGKASLTPRRKLINRLLLGVEVAATLGVVGLFVLLLQSFQFMQSQTAALQAESEATRRAGIVAPTATPIINIEAKVLPGGHTIDENGEAQFNLDEVPIQYRNEYAMRMTSVIVRPTPSPEGPIRVRIPAIQVDSTVVYGSDPEALKLGVGQYEESANPGQNGNLILTAHNDVYSEIFRHLDKLTPGDQVIVSTITRDYTYIIQESTVVHPTDVWPLEQRMDMKRLTLISCYPYRVDNRRIIVFATLQS